MNIDFSKQEKEASNELSKIAKKFKNNDKKIKQRKTTHTRIQVDWIDKLRSEAKSEKLSISKLLDKILSYYFKYKKAFD